MLFHISQLLVRTFSYFAQSIEQTQWADTNKAVVTTWAAVPAFLAAYAGFQSSASLLEYYARPRLDALTHDRQHLCWLLTPFAWQWNLVSSKELHQATLTVCGMGLTLG